MSEADGGRIAAVVPAAGMSRRMGRLKPLLPFGDKPMLARVSENLAAAGAAPVIVVTGHAAPDIVAALRASGSRDANGGDLLCAHNADYAAGGMLSSVQTGVRALPEDAEAFLLALGDQPMVRPATLRALLRARRETGAPIVRPVHGGRRGHPVLFDARCAPDILALPAGATLKTYVTQRRAEAVEVAVDDAAVLADVDTPEDYQRALREWPEWHEQPA